MNSKPEVSDSRTIRMGLLLILIGGIAALDHAFGLSLASRIWPILITMLGVGFIGMYAQRGRREAGFLGIGVYVFCFSLLAFYCSFTSWRNLAFLWPLFIGVMGIAFLCIYGFHRQSRYSLLLGLVLLAVAGEFLILFSLGGQFWWAVLLFLGVSLLIAGKCHGR